MSDQPALDLAKRLNEKIEGFVGYSRSHHDIGLELMRAAQSACTAIEQLSNETESLTSENTRLRALLEEIREEAGEYLFKVGRAGVLGKYDDEDMLYAGPGLLRSIFDRIPPSHKGED